MLQNFSDFIHTYLKNRSEKFKSYIEIYYNYYNLINCKKLRFNKQFKINDIN